MNHITCTNGSIDNFLQTEEIQISLNKEKIRYQELGLPMSKI